MKKAKYIVIEGTEGVGKTTQVKKLVSHYSSIGKIVFETKEPGTPHNLLTLELRKIMLDASYDLPRPARELISQAIRSIHFDKVLKDALKTNDVIIQDRGMLSALAYGEACDNNIESLKSLCAFSTGMSDYKEAFSLYAHVIVLIGDPNKSLARAINSKKEFVAGDAMELMGVSFMERVKANFFRFSKGLQNVSFVSVDGKTQEEVFKELLEIIDN